VAVEEAIALQFSRRSDRWEGPGLRGGGSRQSYPARSGRLKRLGESFHLKLKFCQGFRARSGGGRAYLAGPSVALQITRGPEGLSKLSFRRDGGKDRVCAVAAADSSIPRERKEGWKGPSLCGGGSRQSYSAGLLISSRRRCPISLSSCFRCLSCLFPAPSSRSSLPLVCLSCMPRVLCHSPLDPPIPRCVLLVCSLVVSIECCGAFSERAYYAAAWPLRSSYSSESVLSSAF
jgi:hypothetical protein